jgi:hypothetical protein
MSDNILVEIEEMFGRAVMERIQLEFPGIQVYFGPQPKENSPLVDAVGMEMAKVMGEYFGGSWIAIPSNKIAAKIKAGKETTRRILDLVENAEMSHAEIALHCGVSTRWVYKVIEKSKPKVDPNQLDMFAGIIAEEAA